jgi:hypothetical protein
LPRPMPHTVRTRSWIRLCARGQLLWFQDRKAAWTYCHLLLGRFPVAAKFRYCRIEKGQKERSKEMVLDAND